MTVLDELATHLQTASVGVVGTDIFKGLLPDTPDACVVLLERGGLESTYGFGTSAVYFETSAIQVVCRGADYETARTKAEAAYTALSQIQAQELSGVFYHHVTPQNPPNDALGLDDNQRPRISFNVLAQKDQS